MSLTLALAFNLACTGTIETRIERDLTARPFSTELRVNLESLEWCEGACRTVHPILEAGRTQITLRDSAEVVGRELHTVLTYLNRETGEYHSIAKATSNIDMEWRGTCTKSAFTGWPPVPRKF